VSGSIVSRYSIYLLFKSSQNTVSSRQKLYTTCTALNQDPPFYNPTFKISTSIKSTLHYTTKQLSMRRFPFIIPPSVQALYMWLGENHCTVYQPKLTGISRDILQWLNTVETRLRYQSWCTFCNKR